jgi:hypothetical protein
MFIEIGEGVGVMGKQCTDMLYRCSNNQVPSATCCNEFTESVDCGNILFCGHRNYPTIFLQCNRECVGGFRERVLVFIPGIQYRGRSKQSVRVNLEAGYVVGPSLASERHKIGSLTSSSRSPGHRVPWWVLIWIKRSPLVFLVMSVACFSAGLMLFTYSSGQVRRLAPLSSYLGLVCSSSGPCNFDDNHRSDGEYTFLTSAHR